MAASLDQTGLVGCIIILVLLTPQGGIYLVLYEYIRSITYTNWFEVKVTDSSFHPIMLTRNSNMFQYAALKSQIHNTLNMLNMFI